MTDDRFIRRLPDLMHELAAGDERYIDVILARTARTRQRSAWSFPTRWLPVPTALERLPAHGNRLVVVLVLVAMLALLVATAVFVGSGHGPDLRSQVSNGWIAYSTQPGYGQTSETDTLRGGDIYLVRKGTEPRLIVGRGERSMSNVCPAFSPDGSQLVYGERAGSDRALVILDVAADGSITITSRINVGRGRLAPCPRWSSDGTRVAYLQRDTAGVPDGTVVIRGLDGSTLSPAEGDPDAGDFERDPDRDGPLLSPLLSPTGEWLVRRTGDTVVVARPDGSDEFEVAQPPSFYAIPAWSPDSQWFLYMEDVSGVHFTMHAVSLDRPGELITLARDVRVNGSRSWPERGDVSWQPVLLSPAPPSPRAVATLIPEASGPAVTDMTASAEPDATQLPVPPSLAEEFARPFEYTVPHGSELAATTASSQLYALTEGSSSTYPGFGYEPVSNVRGISVAFAAGASTHAAGDGGANLRLTPDTLLADLRGNPTLTVGPVTSTELGGLAAVESEVRFTGGGGGAYPDIHLDPLEGDEAALVALAFPSTLTVAVVDGGFLLVHVWAADAAELEAWLPLAGAVVSSIRFIDPTPTVAPTASAQPTATAAVPAPPGWTGPVRSDAAGMPVVLMTRDDPDSDSWFQHDDGHDSTIGWADVLYVRWLSTLGHGGRQQKSWHIEFADTPPRFSGLNPAETLITYGLVLETTGDGVADYVVGINNDAPTPGELRVWLTDLATGTTEEQVGPPYGLPIEFSHPDERRSGDPPSTQLRFTLNHGYAWEYSSLRYYAWASVTDHGEVVAWDYAPDFGWLSTSRASIRPAPTPTVVPRQVP